MLDNIREDHREWLGYYSSSEELDRLGTVTRPIQAWYSTATMDLLGSPDTCQALPSITSLLAKNCMQAATAVTVNDLGYLKAVYAANPDKVPGLQKDEIAYRTEQGIAGR